MYIISSDERVNRCVNKPESSHDQQLKDFPQVMMISKLAKSNQ